MCQKKLFLKESHCRRSMGNSSGSSFAKLPTVAGKFGGAVQTNSGGGHFRLTTGSVGAGALFLINNLVTLSELGVYLKSLQISVPPYHSHHRSHFSSNFPSPSLVLWCALSASREIVFLSIQKAYWIPSAFKKYQYSASRLSANFILGKITYPRISSMSSCVPLLFCELAGNLRCNASKDAAPPFIKRAAISNDGTVLPYEDFQTGIDVQEACEELREGLERSQMKRSRKADDQATDHHSLYVTADEQQHWTEVRSTEFLNSAPYHKPTPRYHLSDLTILDKIGEGGQGTILEVIRNETSRAVLKEFKSASRSPQGQWPDEILKIENYYLCNLIGYVDRGDGSIGLLMDKYDTDLRKLIDQRLTTNTTPFNNCQSMLLIASIAIGVKALHDHGVTHRDLKASNILLNLQDSSTYRNIVLTDFEDSSDVVGTGFWRAPEVLLALHQNRRETLTTIFTPKADIYSFAMTCYEILTGQIPLDNHPKSDYNVILVENRRPQLPPHVNPSLADLIHRCWHQNPNLRPTASQLVSEIEHLVSEDPSLSRILVHLIYDEFLEGPQSATAQSPLEYMDELQENLTSQRKFLTPLGFEAGCSYVVEVRKFIHGFGSEVSEENCQAATAMGLAIGQHSGTVQGDVMAPLWWDNVARPVTKLVLKLLFKSGGWIAYVLRSYNKRVALER